MSLQSLIAPLMGVRCFVSYRLVPIPGETKCDKVPIDPRTGKKCDAHDSSVWMTGEEILATGLPVALVLHEALHMFCIDLDSALVGGQWSPFAQAMCAMFPGAAIEVSASGTGLHIIARANLHYIPPHRVKKKGLVGLEIYTRLRFIALTGNGLVGDIMTEHTQTLQGAIAHYFPDAPGADTDEWTTQPQPGWRGGGVPDEQLIAHFCGGRGSARAVFGAGVHFRDLWHANVDVLAKHYPPDPNSKSGLPYDGNAVDQALANHLAYATGYNCEHTLALMWQSALRREKWEHRDDYMRRTVLRAVAGKTVANVSQAQVADPTGVPPPPPPDDGVPPPPPPGPNALWVPPPPGARKARGTYLTVDDQQAMFHGCTYVRDIHSMLNPDGLILAPKHVDVIYGGYEFQMTVDGSGSSKSAWDAFTVSRITEFPKAEGLYFEPREAPGARLMQGGLPFINSWRPIEIPRSPGDVSIFLDHMARLLPSEHDRAVLLAYMAFVVQYPGIKADWCPLLQGVEGNGKTFLSQLMQYCVGERYTHWPVAAQLGNHFNAAFYGKLLVCVEDLKISENQAGLWEALKPMITGKQLTITPKGVDGVTRRVCFNFILNSNYRDALRKTKNDRRICPFYCPQQHEYDLARWGMTEEYFARLFGWAWDHGGAAHILDFLATYPIPAHLNPAVGAHRAPITSSTDDAIRSGRGAAEQEIAEAIEERRPGFRDGWIASTAVDQLLQELGKARAIPREKRRELIEAMGYRLHPELPDGRPVDAIQDQGRDSRPRLYVTRDGHQSEGRNLSPKQIAAMYQDSQKQQVTRAA